MTDGPRTTVVLTMDAATCATVVEQARALCPGAGDPRLHVVRAPKRAGLRLAQLIASTAAPRDAAIVIVADARHDEWLQAAAARPGALRAVYVRPGLLKLQEVLGGLFQRGSVAFDKWSAAVALDARLLCPPYIEAEALFADDEALARMLGARSGDARREPAREACAAASAALLPPLELGAPAHLPLGRFVVRYDGSGLPLLGRGWWGPEPHHVWTAQREATLEIPAGPPGRARRLRLRGFMLVPPDQPMHTSVRLDGAPVLSWSVAESQPREFDVGLQLTDQAHCISLTFDRPVSPAELGGSGDTRLMAMALRDVWISDAGRLRGPASRARDDRPVAARPASDGGARDVAGRPERIVMPDAKLEELPSSFFVDVSESRLRLEVSAAGVATVPHGGAKLGPAQASYGVMAIREGADGLGFTAFGATAANARLESATAMLRVLLSDAPSDTETLSLFQIDDVAYQSVRSAAFGRRAGSPGLIDLICDPYFFGSGGFHDLRSAAAAGELPPWRDRTPTVTWRGSTTHNGTSADGGRVEGLLDIPRVRLALALRDHPAADVGLVGGWLQPESEAEVRAALDRERILRPWLPMAAHATHQLQIDIDGVANAWSLMERLLGGSCVLKVGSPFEQWFYHRLRPWEHFVPVAPDLGDLHERLDWCLSNPAQAEAIAAAGQAVALTETFEGAVAQARTVLAAIRIPMTGPRSVWEP